MPPVTLGELLRLADAHLRAATVPGAGPGPEPVASALDQAGRVTRALSRYLDHILIGHQAEVVLTYRPGTLLHSAAHARLALQRAAGSFTAAARAASSPGPPAGGAAAELAQAAGCLIAGQDLLAGHFTTSDPGIRSPASWWSAAISSGSFGAALLNHIAGQASHIALWAAAVTHLAAGQSSSPPVVTAELDKARRWLGLAATTAAAAQRSGPVSQAEIALLHAIPAKTVPDRQPPQAGEPAGLLEDQIAVTAGRIRAWAHWHANRVPWEPALTADSWRWTATAAAVACDVTAAIAVTLSQRAQELLGPHGNGVPLFTATRRRAREACTAWRAVNAAWGVMTTEVTGLTSPIIPDTGDLVIRLGRLAFTDPLWDPARAKNATLRDPAALAPGPDGIVTALTAVHHAADALAALALADQHSAAGAVAANALYLPTRAMPENLWRTNVARYVWPALHKNTTALTDAYAHAVHASRRLAEALDAAALRFRTPSQMLAIARTAAPSHTGGPTVGRPVPEYIAAEWTPPQGSVEQVVWSLCGDDPVLLARAAAVDQAARNVMTDAWITSGTRGPQILAGELSRAGRVPARKAAAVAAQNFPQPTAQGAAQQAQGEPRQKPSSPSRNPRQPGRSPTSTRP
ncbi:MAG TPA: hypothetical protein VFQ44_09535 [Streptosporangiaceae bacterium]|nr:hypothetical protein [Streptosporangiaceae bacterium]